MGGIINYHFHLSKSQLDSIIEDIILKDSNIDKVHDQQLYSLKGTGYEDELKTVLIMGGNKKYVFSFSISGDSAQWITTENTINLISGAE